MSRTESYIAGCNFKVSFIPPWYQAFCCSLLVESFYFHKLLSHYYTVTRKSIKSQQREEKKVVPALGRHAGSERAPGCSAGGLCSSQGRTSRGPGQKARLTFPFYTHTETTLTMRLQHLILIFSLKFWTTSPFCWEESRSLRLGWASLLKHTVPNLPWFEVHLPRPWSFFNCRGNLARCARKSQRILDWMV